MYILLSQILKRFLKEEKKRKETAKLPNYTANCKTTHKIKTNIQHEAGKMNQKNHLCPYSSCRLALGWLGSLRCVGEMVNLFLYNMKRWFPVDTNLSGDIMPQIIRAAFLVLDVSNSVTFVLW